MSRENFTTPCSIFENECKILRINVIINICLLLFDQSPLKSIKKMSFFSLI